MGTREMNINTIHTAANFMLVAFIKINRLSSFLSEICGSKFSKFFRSWENPDSGPSPRFGVVNERSHENLVNVIEAS
jgi:hypothetical protein